MEITYKKDTVYYRATGKCCFETGGQQVNAVVQLKSPVRGGENTARGIIRMLRDFANKLERSET